nr:MAG: putative RNA-dependent RNA polymerase [Mitoviridae sp.]
MTFNNKMLRIIELLCSKILALYLPKEMEQYAPLVRTYFKDLDRLISSRGLPETVSYVKKSRNCCMRVITGEPLSSEDGVKLKEGWPVWLSYLKPLSNTPEGLRILLTLLTVLRGVKLKAVLDLQPIIKPYEGSDSITEKELRHACRRLGIRPMKCEWKSFHMSTKSGPQGQALLMSLTELALLPQELIADIKLLGGNKLSSIIDRLQSQSLGDYSIVNIWTTIFPPRSKTYRKISYFSDKEGKTRAIAILDYWSQTCLRPLHDSLNRILRRIPNDCTFNQNHFQSCLPPLGPYYSLDLTNATDRMPISLQKRVLAKVIGLEQTEAWARVLVGHEFAVMGMDSTVKYGAGQPMGAYSSWSAMALTHHVLVCVSALRAGYPHFRDYTILGDDLVIANAAVATEYRKLLSELDMPISSIKTHVSQDTYEFAKRWIHAGTEITGFAISGLQSVWKKYSLLSNFLETQQLHGWSLLPDRHPDLVRAIYSIYGRPEQSERVIKLYMVFCSLAKAKMSKEYSELLTTISKYFPGHLSSLQLDPYVDQDLSSYGKTLLVKAKKKLVERDLETFQRDAYIVNDKINKTFSEKFPSLSGQDYRALMRDLSPLVQVLNSLIDESMNLLLIALSGEDPGPEFYLESGLSKYFVSKGVFSLRASHSITLAESMVVKAILDILRDNQGDLGRISTAVGSEVAGSGN